MPRRYDDEDDDDLPVRKPDSVRREELGGMNAMFANTSMVVLVFFALCCNGCFFLPLILSIIAFFSCTDEKARENAKVVLIISVVVVVLSIIGQAVRILTLGPNALKGF